MGSGHALAATSEVSVLARASRPRRLRAHTNALRVNVDLPLDLVVDLDVDLDLNLNVNATVIDPLSRRRAARVSLLNSTDPASHSAPAATHPPAPALPLQGAAVGDS